MYWFIDKRNAGNFLIFFKVTDRNESPYRHFAL